MHGNTFYVTHTCTNGVFEVLIVLLVILTVLSLASWTKLVSLLLAASPNRGCANNYLLQGISPISLNTGQSPHLSINNKYQCSSSSEDHLIVKGGVEEVHLTRKVPDLEVDKRTARDVILVNLVGALQKQSLIWGHFMKNNLKAEE